MEIRQDCSSTLETTRYDFHVRVIKLEVANISISISALIIANCIPQSVMREQYHVRAL